MEIVEETYMGYGFNRQELTDFFHSIGKMVNFGLPPMNFEEIVATHNKLSLDDALKEIELLKAKIAELEKCLPSLLGKYREDDPLAIAIAMRNDEWLKFDENDTQARPPSVEYLVAKLKEDYGMSGALAAAIEKVACPIARRGS